MQVRFKQVIGGFMEVARKDIIHNKESIKFPLSTLPIIALAIAFFPRLLNVAGFPNSINFIHLVIVPLITSVMIFKEKSLHRTQARTIRGLGLVLLLFFTSATVSAFLNEAGIINLIFGFLLLAEPFFLFLAIACIPITPGLTQNMEKWIIGFGLFHVAFAIFQKYVLLWDVCLCSPGGYGEGDAIKGVFLDQGSGHVVSASVAVSLGIYYFFAMRHQPIWIRLLVFLAGLLNIVLSQANQVAFVLMAAFAALSLIKMKDIIKAIFYIILSIFIYFLFVWAIANVPVLSSFNTWIRPGLYGPDGEVTQLKLSGIRIILEHMENPLYWFFGLGPGHTAGRLGGWILREYSHLLLPLGATVHPIPSLIWAATGATWVGTQGSTFFSPFFGWAAIWGDFGLIGLSLYIYLYFILWQEFESDDLTHYLMLTIFVHGFIMTQMEEPGYMLYMFALLGLRWHRNKLRYLL